MKRIFTLLFCAIALAGCSEFEVGNVDGLIIKYTTDDNTKADIDTSLFDRWSVSHRYEDGVGIIEFKKPITSIPDEIFYYCNNLTSIELPGTITSIGESAFWYCIRLKSITIPNSVTSIGGSAFEGCNGLTSITIPNSVTSIGEDAFYHCSSLKSVYCKAKTPPKGSSYMFGWNASGRIIYVPQASVNAYKTAQYWSDYASSIVGYNF